MVKSLPRRRPVTGGPVPARSFDPRRVGALECRAWVTYYRREWLRLLVASVQLVRAAFRMRWPATLRGAWLVLRANQVWAPADNDPDRARAYMERFYCLLAAEAGEPLDGAEAARLEVAWWHAHRQRQHGTGPAVDLVEAVAALYAFVYRVPLEKVRPAATERSEAMGLSDQWVAEGCDLESPLIGEERAALVRSYAALLTAVHR